MDEAFFVGIKSEQNATPIEGCYANNLSREKAFALLNAAVDADLYVEIFKMDKEDEECEYAT